MTEPSQANEARSEQEPFDAHHQLQAAMIDAYEAALLGGAGRQLAADTLGHLVDFTAVHFLQEERLMSHRAYPRLEPHRLAHHRLLDQIRALEAEARVADAATALAALPRLRSWLVDHVAGMDRDLFNWSQAQAQPAAPAR
jgi:hemerythrin-like metal-binding protein